MLDDVLPTFYYRLSSSDPLETVLSFTQNGSEPVAEYLFRKADPSLPESKRKYASALSDAVNPNILFAEVVINPEFTHPTLSAAEIRANSGLPPPQVPIIPEAFTIQLFNPDQQVVIKGEKSTWTGKESWDFEIPQVSFVRPSTSQIDNTQDPNASTSTIPKIMFRWKRDSKFSKDMTCYMTGRSVQGKKSKDPDITVAFFKCGREQSVTIYEPNLQRVDVEDRKGLEVVLLLSAEVIREIYLFPTRESFNISGSAPASRRKNSQPLSTAQANTAKAQGYAMSGAVGNDIPPSGRKTGSPVGQQASSSRPSPIDDETRRRQAQIEQEKKEKERQDREEQRRIQQLIDQEEQEKKKRDAEVEKETERLRKVYGMQGQDYGPKPALPPRTNAAANYNSSSAGPSSHHQRRPQPPQGPPARPMSAGPPPKGSAYGGLSRFFRGYEEAMLAQYQQHAHHSKTSQRRRSEEDTTKLRKR